ncbi:ABC transporter permease [Paenibacillus sp. GCM10012307]|uniref:ABC-2 family transporter protein n=1 Tax=Paenibacillus roseus TaxID=2798579 RepID=A0A934J556_9BACL|nr:ABC-2 family transporter protein [Paenibacillus roseus]MBJ6360547.1 ABC-2 family transporter protein [Paenibacillus roseus]
MSWIHIYFRLAGASLRSQMQYKFNFILSTLLVFLMFGLELMTVSIIIYKFNGIKGWSVYEAGYLFAIMMFVRAFYRIIAGEINGFEKYLVQGMLDQLLLRPMPVLLVLVTRNFRPMAGELVLGTTTMSICLSYLIENKQATLWAIPCSLAVIVSGTIITLAIGLATATVGFWTHRIDELQRITDNAASIASQYPLSIYPKWMRITLLTVLPMGFTSYMPSLYVIRGELGLWILPATMLLAVALLLGALSFWKLGLRHYQSTGT